MSSPNDRSPSTTWDWRKVRISCPAGGHQDSAPKALRWRFRPPRNPRVPLTMTVKFRGGAEAWYEIHSRGGVGRFPGHVCLHDVMDEINRGGGGQNTPPVPPMTPRPPRES